MRYAERNIASSFDFAQKLMHAKDAAEVAALHSEYVNGQMAALTEQAKELSRQASKMGGPAPTPEPIRRLPSPPLPAAPAGPPEGGIRPYCASQYICCNAIIMCYIA